jgi:hypothetical protein
MRADTERLLRRLTLASGARTQSERVRRLPSFDLKRQLLPRHGSGSEYREDADQNDRTENHSHNCRQ